MAVTAVSMTDTIRGLARGPITDTAESVDRDRRFPRHAIDELAGHGCLGLLVPKEFGGVDEGIVELGEACEALGRACASSAMVFLMHSVTMAAIAAGGGERAAGYLRGAAEGRLLGSLAFSERGTGAHFYAPELAAEQEGDHVRITGRKSFVTSGGNADLYLVLVNSDSTKGLDCYVVAADDGVVFDGAWDGLGLTGNASVAASFDARVDRGARIGSPGSGAELVFGAVAPTFLAGLAAVNVGIAAAAQQAAVEHAKSRRYPDGQLLIEIQAVQHAIASVEMTIRGARALVRESARLAASGDDASLVSLMEAKIVATEAAVSATQGALEICGGQGYSRSLPIERHLRDARAGAVMAPTNAVLRTWIGKAIAGLPVP